MTPQEYTLLTRLVQGCATWKNYAVSLINNPQIVNISNYGAFYDLTTQTNAGVTSANVVKFGNQGVTNGIFVQNSNRITFTNGGSYLVNFLGQFITTGGGSNYAVEVWYAVNGNIVPNSSYTFTTSGVNNQVLANVETVYTFNPGDYIQFFWWSQNTYMELLPTSAGTNPTRPASPSTNVTIAQLN